jgi:hypothetical protein
MKRCDTPSIIIPSIRTIGLMLGLVAMTALVPSEAGACDSEIRIAPETLNLRSSGTVVTVHTDVPYSDVDVYSVYLGGVAIDAWKADDRGYFVAKFLMDDIKAVDGLVLNELNVFQLVAITIGGDPICGESEVMVIDRGPQPGRPGRSSSND